MTRFWKLRLSTLAWGLAISYLFTGSLVTSVAMWTFVVAGNTVLMWRYGRTDFRRIVEEESQRLLTERKDLGLASTGAFYGITQLTTRLLARLP